MTAIVMLEGRMTVNDVVVSFGVHCTTIWRLAQRFRTTGAVKDRPRSGRPKRPTPREERYIRITAGRDCLLPATSIVDRVRRGTGVCISVQAVRNTLNACRFKSRTRHKGMELIVHHKRESNACANQYMRRNFRTVVSLDESRFTLKFADGSIHDWRRPGESCVEVCAMPVVLFGGSSLMVWGGVY